MTLRRRKSIAAEYKHLIEMGHFILEIAFQAGFSEDDAYKIQLAVDEACSNIIEHAYGGGSKENNICCVCKILTDKLKIELYDNGASFNPNNVPSPNLSTKLEDRDKGGLGLFLIRQIMDFVEFQPQIQTRCASGTYNRLVLVKYRYD